MVPTLACALRLICKRKRQNIVSGNSILEVAKELDKNRLIKNEYLKKDSLLHYSDFLVFSKYLYQHFIP
jgi:hypothetical protein